MGPFLLGIAYHLEITNRVVLDLGRYSEIWMAADVFLRQWSRKRGITPNVSTALTRTTAIAASGANASNFQSLSHRKLLTKIFTFPLTMTLTFF